MKRKQWTSLLMAAGMTASVLSQASAAMTTSEIKTDEAHKTMGETVLEGTINATQLCVTVPTNIPFTLDPSITVDGNDTAALTQQVTMVPESPIQIINKSVVPVYTKISEVATSVTNADDSATGITLTQDVTEVDVETNDKYMMFAFKEVGAIENFDTASDWLTAGEWDDTTNGGAYTLNDRAGRLEALGHTKEYEGVEKDNTLTMQISARARFGWAHGDTFTVTPTIVVSAVPYTLADGE